MATRWRRRPQHSTCWIFRAARLKVEITDRTAVAPKSVCSKSCSTGSPDIPHHGNIYIYIYMCGYIMGILIVGRVEKDGISSWFFFRSPMNCYFRSPNTGVQFVLSTFHHEIKTLKLSLISPKEPGSRMDGTSEIKKKYEDPILKRLEKKTIILLSNTTVSVHVW